MSCVSFYVDKKRLRYYKMAKYIVIEQPNYLGVNCQVVYILCLVSGVRVKMSKKDLKSNKVITNLYIVQPNSSGVR